MTCDGLPDQVPRILPSYPKLPSRASGKGPLPKGSGSISSDSRVDFELITSFYPATRAPGSNIIVFLGSGCPGSEITRKWHQVSLPGNRAIGI